jgi:succinate-semialdehyde dehydrogenase/glutarate-semialdehyde dehydrogenase
VKDQSLIKNQAFIAGQWVDAKDGAKIKVTSEWAVTFDRRSHPTDAASDPATGEELGTVPELGVEDTKKAIQHAAEAFKTWSKTTAKVQSKRFIIGCIAALTFPSGAPRHPSEIVSAYGG